jgi:hypothetical protein
MSFGKKKLSSIREYLHQGDDYTFNIFGWISFLGANHENVGCSFLAFFKFHSGAPH